MVKFFKLILVMLDNFIVNFLSRGLWLTGLLLKFYIVHMKRSIRELIVNIVIRNMNYLTENI